MARLQLLMLAILASPWLIDSAKILVVFTFPGKSHGILGEGFVRILLEAGHEVTYVTPFPKKEVQPNLRYIDVGDHTISFASNTVTNLTKIVNKESESMILGLLKSSKEFVFDMVKSAYSSPQMQKLLNDPNEKFDLVIIEWMFGEIHSGLSAVFDCPYIWFSSCSPHWMVLNLIDETPSPSFNPEIFSSNVPPFSFLQRIEELFRLIIWGIIRVTFVTRTEKELYPEIFEPVMAKKGRTLPPYEELRFQGSFMFGNSDVSTNRPMSLPENYKHIAGYHINPQVKPLPEDLKKIMESAKNGVIYFSMGSNVKSKELPDEIKKSLLKMFGTLKYTVIWKFEDPMSDLPKNVHILQWAPQPSILAHPNCKLFITHGGLLSTIETVHFGKPIIGVPVFADQFINVEVAKTKGFALRVDLSYEMAEDLKVAIEEILGNPKYKQRIEELNYIFHDRPVTPAAELTHWVNHVLHTKGAPHLRSLALLLPWYQKLYLDFLALFLVILFVTVKAIKFACCSRKKPTSAKKNN